MVLNQLVSEPPLTIHGTSAATKPQFQPSVGSLFYYVMNVLVLQVIRGKTKKQAGHKLRLNSVPPTSLSNYCLTYWHIFVCV